MKKLLTLAVLTAISNLCNGQGYISFVNTSGTRISTNDTLNTASAAMGADPIGTWYYALFAAPSTQNTVTTNADPTLNGWTYVAIGTNVASAGRLSGDNSDNGNAVNLPGFPAGATADFAVAGWSANIGTSWSAAQAFFNNGDHDNGSQATLAGYFEIAPSVANDLGVAPLGGPYNPTFGGSGLLHGFTLQYYAAASSPSVPEPDSISFFGLGLALILIFHSRINLSNSLTLAHQARRVASNSSMSPTSSVTESIIKKTASSVSDD